MVRRAKAHRWSDHPELLTAMRSPWEHFQKADWNFTRYEDAIMARPCDSEAVMYTAIDFAIAVVSLRDWTRRWLFKDKRKSKDAVPSSPTNSEFEGWIEARIPWQKAIEAIANTAKHGEYKDSGWTDGTAMPATFVPAFLKSEHDACISGSDLFAFMHKHRKVVWWDVGFRKDPNQDDAEPGYVIFGDALDQWKSVLEDLNLSEDL